MSVNPKFLVKGSTLDTSKITFSDAKSNDSGGKSIYMNYDNHPLLLQTPKMSLPYGLSVFDKGEYPKYTIEGSFRDMDTNQSLNNFYDKLEELEEKLVEGAMNNSMSWFKKKKMGEEVATALLNPLLRKSRDKETGELDGRYPPTFRMKLPVINGKTTCKIFDFSKNELDSSTFEELFNKGGTIKAILRCNGVWIAGGKYGCSWGIVQVMVDAVKNVDNYSFLEDNDDNEDNKDNDDNSDSDSEDELVEDSD